MRTFRLLLFGLALLWTQLALTGHGIEHAFHDHDEACAECLALPGFAAMPARPPCLFAPSAAHDDAPVAVPPAPTFAPHPPFRSRAPPSAQSR